MVSGLIGPFPHRLRPSRASREVAQLFEPFIGLSERRLGAISSLAWRKPYIAGLLITLITLNARRLSRMRFEAEPSDSRMAAIQTGAYAILSSQSSDGLGEMILALSLDNDAAFALGCRNGQRFFEILVEQTAHASPIKREMFFGFESSERYQEPARVEQNLALWCGEYCIAIWQQIFDCYVHQ